MIKATRFHVEFLDQVNRINSNFNKRISVAQRDLYFNRAKDFILENFFALAETNTTIRNHLRQLERKKVPLECTRIDNDCCVFAYPKDFYRLLRQRAIMCTDCCDEPREIMIRTVQTDDLGETLKDPYWEPSFEWEETVGEEGADGYYVYKKPEHVIKQVYIDYMFKPKDIAAPSLLDCDSKSYINAAGERISSDQDFEVDSTYLWRKIVDLSVAFALRDLGQGDDFQTKVSEIMFSDKIYMV